MLMVRHADFSQVEGVQGLRLQADLTLAKVLISRHHELFRPALGSAPSSNASEQAGKLQADELTCETGGKRLTGD